MRFKFSLGFNWWSVAFVFNFIFQIYRGSREDIIFFGIALILIFLESTKYLDWIPEFKKLRDSKANIFILIGISLYLLFTKRETPLTPWLFSIFFIFMFLDLWRREDGDHIKLSGSQIKSAKSWSLIGIALCFWELIAFVLASISKDDYAYPTISVLISPNLDGLIGRGAFIICWAALGFVILKDWREPR